MLVEQEVWEDLGGHDHLDRDIERGDLAFGVGAVASYGDGHLTRDFDPERACSSRLPPEFSELQPFVGLELAKLRDPLCRGLGVVRPDIPEGQDVAHRGAALLGYGGHLVSYLFGERPRLPALNHGRRRPHGAVTHDR